MAHRGEESSTDMNFEIAAFHSSWGLRMHASLAKLPTSPVIRKSMEFSISPIYLTMWSFFIEWFEGIDFEIRWSKCSPSSQVRKEKKRVGNSVCEREMIAHGQRQDKHKNTNHRRDGMSLFSTDHETPKNNFFEDRFIYLRERAWGKGRRRRREKL